MDLLTDEPLELAIAVRKIARAKSTNNAEWWAVTEAMDSLVERLQALNEPPPKAA